MKTFSSFVSIFSILIVVQIADSKPLDDYVSGSAHIGVPSIGDILQIGSETTANGTNTTEENATPEETSDPDGDTTSDETTNTEGASNTTEEGSNTDGNTTDTSTDDETTTENEPNSCSTEDNQIFSLNLPNLNGLINGKCYLNGRLISPTNPDFKLHCGFKLGDDEFSFDNSMNENAKNGKNLWLGLPNLGIF